MRRLLPLVVLTAACSRNLDLPTVQVVSVSPAAAALAPRERLTLSASGGAGGYRFAFDGGLRPSGDDAVLDPLTGAYRAGSRGSAQDVIVVTDAAGARAVARIAVGPRLVVTPATTVTSPGGAVEIQASGGKPPYAFALLDAQAASTLAAAGDDGAGYVAGALGDRTEHVVVTDATWEAADPSAATASCEIRVGSPVKVYASANTAGRVAPYETIDFLAVGGQPPYTFELAHRDPVTGLPPSGGSIDPATGRYQAGPNGSAPGAAAVVDEIVARDTNGQTSAVWPITVGGPLSLSLPDALIAPGRAVQLVASGGKPPYAFAFAPRGNRSGGVVDAVTGSYRPGPGQGSWDVLEVTDATGLARATIPHAPSVGFQEIPIGDLAVRVLPARLRGALTADPAASPLWDVVVLHMSPSRSTLQQLTSVSFPAGSDPVATRSVPAGLRSSFWNSEVADVDGNGHDDLVVFQPAGIALLLAGIGGDLAEGPTFPLALEGCAVAKSTSPREGTRFYTGLSCDSGAGPQSGLVVIDWDPAPAPSTLCVAHPTPLSVGSSPLAAVDADGDGTIDLVRSAGNAIVVDYRAGAAFQPAPPAALPPGCSHPVYTGDFVPLAGNAKTFVAVGMDCGGAFRLARLDGGSPAARTPTLDPAGGVTIAGALGVDSRLATFRPTTGAEGIVAAWSQSASRLHGVRFDPGGPTTLDLAPALPTAIEWAAFAEVNGDRAPDLVAVGPSVNAYIMLGDGDGRFGLRQRLRGISAWSPAGDLDADGIDDLIVATSDRQLAILLGGADQLAWQPGVPLPAPVSGLAVGDFLGDGSRSILFQDRKGAFFRARIGPGLTVGPLRELAAAELYPSFSQPSVADLGGTAPGPDFWWLFGSSHGRSAITAAVFDAPGTARLVGLPEPDLGCAQLPVGAGSFLVAAVCPDVAQNGIVLRTSTGGAFSSFGGWAGLPGGTERNAEAVAVGHDQDGSAVFVATPSGPPGTRHRYAVTVAPGAGAVRVQDLGAEADIPAWDGCLLADVDGDGTRDLVVTRWGAGRVLRGTARPDGTDYVLGPTFRAAGTPSAALHLADRPGAGLVIRMGDDLVLLRHEGGGRLQ